MAGERRNIEKDEAELLNPSSSSSSSSSPNPAAPNPSATPPSFFLNPPRSPAPPPPPPACTELQPSVVQLGEYEATVASSGSINRCLACRRKVKLTAFRCRCGELFCDRHRHSNLHDCGFDYKAAARAEIARNNPVVRAAKILKI